MKKKDSSDDETKHVGLSDEDNDPKKKIALSKKKRTNEEQATTSDKKKSGKRKASPQPERPAKKQKSNEKPPPQPQSQSQPQPQLQTQPQFRGGVFRVRKHGCSFWKRIKLDMGMKYDLLKEKITALIERDEEIDKIYELPDTLIEGDNDLELLQSTDLEFTTIKKGPTALRDASLRTDEKPTKSEDNEILISIDDEEDGKKKIGKQHQKTTKKLKEYNINIDDNNFGLTSTKIQRQQLQIDDSESSNELKYSFSDIIKYLNSREKLPSHSRRFLVADLIKQKDQIRQAEMYEFFEKALLLCGWNVGEQVAKSDLDIGLCCRLIDTVLLEKDVLPLDKEALLKAARSSLGDIKKMKEELLQKTQEILAQVNKSKK